MRIEFCKEEYTRDNIPIATFEVLENLTEEECEAIYDYIYKKIEEWEIKRENGENCDDEFDYQFVCYNACRETIPNKLIENPITKTFYI